jgi:hypothetical protein
MADRFAIWQGASYNRYRIGSNRPMSPQAIISPMIAWVGNANNSSNMIYDGPLTQAITQGLRPCNPAENPELIATSNYCKLPIEN